MHICVLGQSTIQTKSLLDYSAFCWATGHLRFALIESVPNTVFVCNGFRPSDIAGLLDEESIVPSNKEIAPTVLPIAPEPRFWPSVIVSAEDDNSKKQRSNKHTNQPSTRQTKVYGKKKNSNSVSAEALELTLSEKLNCKYR